ncbi:MAG: glycosyltransferase family 39 protein [Okeania sp. SIO2G4]|nr:glycosyltransferase family 39 protein [Okeania sp. SIO2G5]NEP94660.1 glycosyltransferase family 39 protein [Okeania sp. SIO2F5]NEQ92418.1 glycosyltransferase family 39 protein [Okeania sp. SIO2G4]
MIIKRKILYIFLLLLYLVLAIIIVPMVVPLKEEFQLNFDEGLQLMRASLYMQGYSPQTEIWSDQPFFFPALLSLWFSIVGKSVFSARLLTVIFSALLIWFFFETIRISLGIFPAIIGAISLAASSGFIRFSSAVMIGIPSLSLGVISIYFLFIYKKSQQKYLLIISGVLFALSLKIKFFTVFLIPIILLVLFDVNKINFESNQKPRSKLMYPLLLWIISLVVIFLIVSLLFNELSYQQLFGTHFGEEIQAAFTMKNGFEKLSKVIINKDYDLFSLAIFGILVVFVRHRWEGIFPVAWLGTGTLLLLNHRPVWPHHYCLIAIPMAWLTAYASVPFFDLFQQREFRLGNYFWASISLILMIFALLTLKPKVSKDIPSLQKNYEPQFAVINRLIKHKNSTKWLFTDVPIYGFYADLLVPPEIAVFSTKRIKTGQLTQDEVYELLVKYRPEQILIGRFKGFIYTSSDVDSYINKFYSKSNDISAVDHYILKSLK